MPTEFVKADEDRQGDTYTTMLDNNWYYTIFPNGTANCQLFVMAWTEAILHLSKKEDKIKEFVRAGRKALNKRMCLIDIKDENIKDIKDCFSDKNIILEAPYISTNGNKMCIFLIKIPYPSY